MKDAIAKVVEFHRAMSQRIGDQPDIGADRQLRLDLIDEELQEMRDALAANSVVGVADALADLAYVIVGAAVTWGIPLAEVFDEVHRSNMTKVGGERRADGKILKPAGYQPPDIAGVLASHAAQRRVDTAVDKLKALAELPMSPCRDCPVERSTVECDHGLSFPTDPDDEARALKLSVSEIRRFYPRLDGECPKGCGYRGIAYVSTAHYVAGDW